MFSCNSRATRRRSASCTSTRRWDKARSRSSLRRASVMSVTTMPMVARWGTLRGQRTNRDMHRQLRTVAGVQERLDFGAGFGRPFQERSQRGLVRGGEKAAKGAAHHLLQRAV